MSQILMPPHMASQCIVLDTPFPTPTRMSYVLVVDNDRYALESLGDFLQLSLQRVEVLYALSAREGLRMLEAHSVDAVLCEFQLTGMNGVEFLKECRRIQPAAVRMLYTSSPTEDMAIQAINEARIDHFFHKPLEPTALTEVLTRALDVTRSATMRQLAFDRILRGRQAGPGLKFAAAPRGGVQGRGIRDFLAAPKTFLAAAKVASASRPVAS